MTRTKLSIIPAAFAGVLAVTPAHANRTFVSGLGSDANPCSVTAPCRTLQAAFNVTAPGGEIQVLDPTGYGTLIITHAVTIEGHGWASMNPAAANGIVITVNAGASDKVSLRGLVVNGFGLSGTFGITFNNGGALDIRDSVFRNLATGIQFSPVAASDLLVTNTRVASNAVGIDISAAFAKVTGVLSKVWIEGNTIGGLFVSGSGAGGATVAVNESEVTGNGFNGIEASSFSASNAVRVTVRNSNVSLNGGPALLAQNPGAFIEVTRSTVTSNATGIEGDSGGVIESYVDNNIVGNTTTDGTAGAQLTYN